MLTLLDESDPVLRQIAEPITVFDEKLDIFGGSLFATMITRNGVGLAAPQVGVSSRIIAVDLRLLQDDVLVNPVILESSGIQINEEGCLSFPGLFLNVERAQVISVEYYSLKGEKRGLRASGYPAIVIQHEIDHLDGKLFIDRVNSLRLALARKNLRNRNKV